MPLTRGNEFRLDRFKRRPFPLGRTTLEVDPGAGGEKAKIKRPLLAQQAAAEKAIEALEDEQKKLTSELDQLYGQENGKKIPELARRLGEIEREIDEKFAELEEVSDKIDAIDEKYQLGG